MQAEATDNQKSQQPAETKQRRSFWQRWKFPLMAFGAGLCCLPVDLGISGYFRQPQPSFLREIVENTEPFGHGIGVAFILGSLALCDRLRAVQYAKAGLTVLAAGLTTDLFKILFGRVRPRDLDWDSVTAVVETFLGWRTFWVDSKLHTSFPSGHSTVAFALATCLAVMHPRGKVVFFVLATLVAFGRVVTKAHYTSDVLVGAAVGFTVASLLSVLMRLDQTATRQVQPAPKSSDTKADSDSLLNRCRPLVTSLLWRPGRSRPTHSVIPSSAPN